MKYELGQVIWFLKDNVVHSALVLSRMMVENQINYWATTPEDRREAALFGSDRKSYSTALGVVEEEDAYKTLEELLRGLVKKANTVQPISASEVNEIIDDFPHSL